MKSVDQGHMAEAEPWVFNLGVLALRLQRAVYLPPPANTSLLAVTLLKVTWLLSLWDCFSFSTTLVFLVWIQSSVIVPYHCRIKLSVGIYQIFHLLLPCKINVISSKWQGVWWSLSLTSWSLCQFWDLSQENNPYSPSLNRLKGTPAVTACPLLSFILIEKFPTVVCRFLLGNIMLRYTATPLPLLRFEWDSPIHRYTVVMNPPNSDFHG